MSTPTSSAAARERWRAFLDQLAAHHLEIISEAGQLVSNKEQSPVPLVWLWIDGRMFDLQQKIIDTWNSTVVQAYEAEGVPRATWWADRRLGEDLAFALENERVTLQNRLFSDGGHARGWQAARTEWLTMRVAERSFRLACSPRPLELLREYEHAQIAYFTRYVRTRAVDEPALRDLSHEVRSRMDGFYDRTAEFEEAWVNAGRPRTAI